MNPELIRKRLVQQLGPNVIKKIDALKNGDRSSYLEPIVFYFHQEHRIDCGSDGYVLNDKVIPIPEDYNNWKVFNDCHWELVCKFDEKAFHQKEYTEVVRKHGTHLDVKYKLYFDGTETIADVLERIKMHPSYGHFCGIKQIDELTYELEWGT